jgi:hypothetical protein
VDSIKRAGSGSVLDKKEQNKTEKSIENGSSLTKRVVSIHRVPWIGKYLFAIEEAG